MFGATLLSECRRQRYLMAAVLSLLVAAMSVVPRLDEGPGLCLLLSAIFLMPVTLGTYCFADPENHFRQGKDRVQPTSRRTLFRAKVLALLILLTILALAALLLARITLPAAQMKGLCEFFCGGLRPESTLTWALLLTTIALIPALVAGTVHRLLPCAIAVAGIVTAMVIGFFFASYYGLWWWQLMTPENPALQAYAAAAFLATVAMAERMWASEHPSQPLRRYFVRPLAAVVFLAALTLGPVLTVIIHTQFLAGPRYLLEHGLSGMRCASASPDGQWIAWMAARPAPVPGHGTWFCNTVSGDWFFMSRLHDGLYAWPTPWSPSGRYCLATFNFGPRYLALYNGPAPGPKNMGRLSYRVVEPATRRSIVLHDLNRAFPKEVAAEENFRRSEWLDDRTCFFLTEDAILFLNIETGAFTKLKAPTRGKLHCIHPTRDSIIGCVSTDDTHTPSSFQWWRFAPGKTKAESLPLPLAGNDQRIAAVSWDGQWAVVYSGPGRSEEQAVSLVNLDRGATELVRAARDATDALFSRDSHTFRFSRAGFLVASHDTGYAILNLEDHTVQKISLITQEKGVPADRWLFAQGMRLSPDERYLWVERTVQQRSCGVYYAVDLSSGQHWTYKVGTRQVDSSAMWLNDERLLIQEGMQWPYSICRDGSNRRSLLIKSW